MPLLSYDNQNVMSSFAAATSPRLCVPDGMYYVVMHQEQGTEEPGALSGWASDGASVPNGRPKPIVMDVDCGMHDRAFSAILGCSLDSLKSRSFHQFFIVSI